MTSKLQYVLFNLKDARGYTFKVPFQNQELQEKNVQAAMAFSLWVVLSEDVIVLV